MENSGFYTFSKKERKKKKMLTSQSKRFNVIITFSYNQEKEKIKENLRSYLTAVCSEYSFIEHNKDELASGLLKTDHIHAVYVKGSRTRVITEINYLQKALGYTDSERGLISVDTCGSYERSLRYLIHKDDPMKHQYDVGEIVTNLDGKLISEIMTAECIRDELNIDELIKIVLTCKGLRSAIYSTIGLKYSVRYGKIIDNLIKEYYGKLR